ncbi:MAG: formimidoylglutamase [Sphingobacteriia bacterium]|nr:formimidoylglutamase [Sphingobacteriia bacterium]
MSLATVIDFLEPVSLDAINDDESFRDTQLGKHVLVYDDVFPDVADADVVIIGCDEQRGAGFLKAPAGSANEIRKAFYNLYHWHKDVTIADIGNVKTGAAIADTYAAIKFVVSELIAMGKRVVIIGASHDVTLAQYAAYAESKIICEAVCVDAKIDLDMNSALPADKFLMQVLTGEPNFIKHYHHIGFQSYLVHPQMLETIDKLRFDCYRVGKVKESLEEMEPAIRNANIFSFDITAIQHAHAPVNKLTPNGFTGEEACTLMQYAGMSTNPCSVGIYGYLHTQDTDGLSAKQIAHMIWYLMDGVYKGKQESVLDEKSNFNEIHLAFAEIDTVFLQSKKTGRWWMQSHDGKMIPCSKADYIIASHNEIPERWMRMVERN